MRGWYLVFQLHNEDWLLFVTVVPFAVVPIGYTEVEQGKLDRYKEERVHYNEF